MSILSLTKTHQNAQCYNFWTAYLLQTEIALVCKLHNASEHHEFVLVVYLTRKCMMWYPVEVTDYRLSFSCNMRTSQQFVNQHNQKYVLYLLSRANTAIGCCAITTMSVIQAASKTITLLKTMLIQEDKTDTFLYIIFNQMYKSIMWNESMGDRAWKFLNWGK